MLTSSQEKILKALLKAMRPIVHMILKAGLSHREMSEIVKQAFADVATQHYGIRGRPTNISRVAVMTGLTRKEVKRLREKAAAGHESDIYRENPAADVLHYWHTDSEFLDEFSLPLVLPFQGPGVSFEDLVRKYAGDIPAGAMRTELKRVGAVLEGERGHLTVKSRSFSSGKSDDIISEGLDSAIYPLATTLLHNMDVSESEKPREMKWVQRSIYSKKLQKKDLPRIRRLSRTRLVEFSESLDDLITTYELAPEEIKADQKDGVTVAVGLYYCEGQ